MIDVSKLGEKLSGIKVTRAQSSKKGIATKVEYEFDVTLSEVLELAAESLSRKIAPKFREGNFKPGDRYPVKVSSILSGNGSVNAQAQAALSGLVAIRDHYVKEQKPFDTVMMNYIVQAGLMSEDEMLEHQENCQ